MRYALLDAWRHRAEFQTLLRDAILKQQGRDRIMIGWNGTIAAATTDRDANPDAVARTLIALFQGFLLQKVWNEPFDIDVIAGTIERMLMALATTERPIKPRKKRVP